MRRALRDVDVLINAAGPFAWTAERLAKDALDVNCHYVDINGEIDVYKKLDDLGRYASQRRRAMVCSAGHTAAASDLLLDAALRELGGAHGPRLRPRARGGADRHVPYHEPLPRERGDGVAIVARAGDGRTHAGDGRAKG